MKKLWNRSKSWSENMTSATSDQPLTWL